MQLLIVVLGLAINVNRYFCAVIKASSLIIAALVLLSLLLPFGLMQQMQQEQAHARQEAMLVISQQMPEKSLIYLSIPHAEMQAETGRFLRIHEREFVWDGMMYDIVQRFEGAFQTWFLVYPDHKETHVLNQKIALAKAFNQKESLKTNSTVVQISWNWFADELKTFSYQLFPVNSLAYNYIKHPYNFFVKNQPEHPPQHFG